MKTIHISIPDLGIDKDYTFSDVKTLSLKNEMDSFENATKKDSPGEYLYLIKGENDPAPFIDSLFLKVSNSKTPLNSNHHLEEFSM